MKKLEYKGDFRPKCFVCGKFVGEGGKIDIFFDWWEGELREGYHLCKECLLIQTAEPPPDPDNPRIPEMDLREAMEAHMALLEEK